METLLCQGKVRAWLWHYKRDSENRELQSRDLWNKCADQKRNRKGRYALNGRSLRRKGAINTTFLPAEVGLARIPRGVRIPDARSFQRVLVIRLPPFREFIAVKPLSEVPEACLELLDRHAVRMVIDIEQGA